MHFAGDESEPVIKARGNDEREKGLLASQETSKDQFRDINYSGSFCSQHGENTSDAGHPGRPTDEYCKTAAGTEEHLKMDNENDPSDFHGKKYSKSALLNVPYFDDHADGFINRGFCAVTLSTNPQNRDGDVVLNHRSDVNQIASEIINSLESNLTPSLNLSMENEQPKNRFSDRNGHDQVRDADQQKEFFNSGDKKEPNVFAIKDNLSSQASDSAGSIRESNHNKELRTCPELNGSHQNVYQKEITVQKGEESEIQEKGKIGDTNIPEQDEDTVCGIGSFRPQWLQEWATPRCYLVLYSFIGILQSSYYAYLISTISTLEKRFAFKSKITGVIMIIDEITPLALGILVGYFGGKTHRPRMVAFGMFLSTLCCLFSALPYFIYGPAQHLVYKNSTGPGPELCNLQQRTEQCDEDDRPPTLSAVVLLILGSFLKGFGNLAYFAIGLSYMDDNALKKNTPIYFGISFALRLLGPTSGFLMSSAFLKIYENPFEDPGYGTDDPRWIGAWWLGFVVQGVLLFIFTFPIMLFPRRLPSKSNLKPKVQSSTEHEDFIQKIKGLHVGLKRLSSNELFVFMCIGTILDIIGGFGHYMMMPKYMEHQFRLSASDASLYSGPPGLVALQISTVVGSIIIWKYHLNAKTLMAGKIVTDTVGTLLLLLMMVPTCPKVNFADTRTFNVLGKGVELQNECNKDCLCTTNVYTPLCGPDGVTTYFSSCHAGCSEVLPGNITTTEAFGNCSCVVGANKSFITVDEMQKGFCPIEGCWTQTIFYITILPVIHLFTSFFRVGHTMILLRSVDPQDKSFALGTFETLLSLFGFIPYPIIYGALVDSVCLIWEFSCGVTGNCWVYDMEKFNFLLHSVCASFCFGAVLCNIRIYCISHKIRDLYKEEDDGDSIEKPVKSDSKQHEMDMKSQRQDSVESTKL